MNEIWKPVRGYEGKYEVSNIGNVRSLDRYIENRYNIFNGRFANKKQIENGDFKVRKKFVKGRLLKPTKSNRGYLFVYIDGKNRTVHRLVADAFLSKGDLDLVEHLNHNKSDNRVDNLMWSDQSANVRRSVRDGIWNNQWTKIK